MLGDGKEFNREDLRTALLAIRYRGDFFGLIELGLMAAKEF